MFHSRVIIILISLLNTIPSHVTTLKINWIRIKITFVTLTLHPGV